MNRSDVLHLVDGNEAACRRVVHKAGKVLGTDEQHVISLIADELGVERRIIEQKRHPKRAREEDIDALNAITQFLGTLRPNEVELRTTLQNAALSHVYALSTPVPTFGVSERARQLGVKIPDNCQFLLGRDVLAAYMTHYKKRPQQRVFITEEGKPVMMNCYIIEECHQTVDQAIQEFGDQCISSSSSSVFSSE